LDCSFIPATLDDEDAPSDHAIFTGRRTSQHRPRDWAFTFTPARKRGPRSHDRRYQDILKVAKLLTNASAWLIFNGCG
jgi:hypothetical protein